MKSKTNTPNINWNFENCRLEALKYNVKKDFQNNSRSAYNKAYNKRWINDICSHMKQNKHWTFSSCQQEALKYDTKAGFKEKCGSGYGVACANKWIDEISQHMVVTGTLKKRCIYVAEFNNAHVYVGLTYSFNKRIKKHLIDENSSVYKHIKSTNITPIFKQITEYIDIDEAIIKEGYYVNYYKVNGWDILNQTKTGTIGGNVLIWSKEKCQEEALKYKSRHEYFKNSCSSYQASKRYGWFDEICQHMKLMKKRNYWCEETCKSDALKYITRSEYQKESPRSYFVARKLNILDDICQHMQKKIKNTCN